MKLLVVFGTRPEVIKLAPLIKKADHYAPALELVICSTGQHRELLLQTLEACDIKPDISYNTMSTVQTLNSLASRLLLVMDETLEKVQPDWVLVQGDTATAFNAGLAAFHRKIKIAHVEAGLRTGDLSSPFPEEGYRSLISRIASRHFAPTSIAKKNLVNEGIDEKTIVVTGNTGIDAIEQVRNSWNSKIPELPWSAGNLNQDQILVTCHRRENFGEALSNICVALRRLCDRYKNYNWVFPLHLNPVVRETVLRELGNISNLKMVEPVDYNTSLYLMSRSTLVVSDSGGIQEEAPHFGVPVVVMRNHTERSEGINAGFATLAGHSIEGIETAVSSWLDNPERRHNLKNRPNPYGDGRASQRILASLLGESFEEFHG